jgi:hypothetical protein
MSTTQATPTPTRRGSRTSPRRRRARRQVAEQQDALARAADGFVGAATTDDAFEADLYEAELEYGLDDLAGQASDFRTQGPEVQQVFWEGFDEGLPSD